MKKKCFKKLNNSGSTLVVAIISVAFVAILGTIVLAAAVTNAKLKSMDKQSKESFYNAETAVEYIYAKLGQQCMDSIQQSYTEVSSNLLSQVMVGSIVYYEQKDNETANDEMKADFYANVIKTFSESYVPTKEEAVAVFNEYLASAGTKNCDNAEVTSVADVTFNDNIVFKDVLVQYKNPETSYFSTVKVDISVNYPDMTIDFTNKSSKTLNSYLDYSLIAMKNIDFGYNSGDMDMSASTTLRGGVFAGNNINVQSGSNLEVKALIESDDTSKGLVIAGKDINITGGVSNDSILNVYKADVWCTNYNLDVGSSSKIGNLNFNTMYNSKAYVADDLNIIGNNCQATLGNQYFGYGNGDTDDKSSAIVVNGKNAVLNLITLKKFVLAGRAYIDFTGLGVANDVSPYLTADSIALKGNQEIYLVPAKYLSVADNSEIRGTNPVNASLADTTSDVSVNMNGFFAYDLGLLDSTEPYTLKAVSSNICYIYLNFKDNKTAADYVRAILNEQYLETLYSNSGMSITTEAINDRSDLYLVIDKSLNKFITDGKIGLTLSENANVFSSGTLIQVSNDGEMSDFSTDDVSLIPVDELDLTCMDMSVRYRILKSFLFDAGSANLFADMPSQITFEGQSFTTTGIDGIGAYDRVVNTELLSQLESNYISYTDDTHTKITAVLTNRDSYTSSGIYTIPAGVTSGIILGYNTDIYVSNSFEGLIITNGSIHVSGTNTIITTGTTDLASQILDSNTNISKYFLAYASSASDETVNDNISSLTINDMLSMNNWSKNDGE